MDNSTTPLDAAMGFIGGMMFGTFGYIMGVCIFFILHGDIHGWPSKEILIYGMACTSIASAFVGMVLAHRAT